MADKKFFWLKLHDDFFSSKRIKKLRKLGSDFVIIYLKMQLLSLQKGGVLEYSGIEDDFASEIALDIDEDSDKVQLTISYLQSCGLLETGNNNEFILPYVEKCTGSESKWAEYKRKEREIGQCPTAVQPLIGNRPVEKEIEKEIEIDKDISKSTRVDYQAIVDKFHSICVSYPKVKSLSESRKKAIKARLNAYTIDDFIKVFEKAEASDFMKGSNNRNWTATFDWLLKDSNFAKVLDGNYDNKGSNKPKPKNQFNQFENKQDYDFEALDKWGGG